MNKNPGSVSRTSCEIPFLAVPERLGHLRRALASNLRLWGVPGLLGPVQECVTELITDVVTHVGAETPTWVTVSLDGAHLRVEVRDPDPRRFPAQEQGPDRCQAVRRGVTIHDYGKTSWCELATGLPATERPAADPRVAGAEAVLTLYGRGPAAGRTGSPLARAASEEAATELIADLLHWLQAHGTDPDTALDRAQIRFESGFVRT